MITIDGKFWEYFTNIMITIDRKFWEYFTNIMIMIDDKFNNYYGHYDNDCFDNTLRTLS